MCFRELRKIRLPPPPQTVPRMTSEGSAFDWQESQPVGNRWEREAGLMHLPQHSRQTGALLRSYCFRPFVISFVGSFTRIRAIESEFG